MEEFDDVLSCFIFCCIGLKMSGDEGQEEYEEVQAELRKKEEEVIILRTYIPCCVLILLSLYALS